MSVEVLFCIHGNALPLSVVDTSAAYISPRLSTATECREMNWPGPSLLQGSRRMLGNARLMVLTVPGQMSRQVAEGATSEEFYNQGVDLLEDVFGVSRSR